MQTLKVPARTWTFLEDKGIQFQVIEGFEIFYTYSTTTPTKTPPILEQAFRAKKFEFINTLVGSTTWVYAVNGATLIYEEKPFQDVRNFAAFCPNSIIPANLISEETYVATNTAIGDYEIVVNDATGIVAGRYVIMFNQTVGNAYYGFVQSVATNTLTMNVPVNDIYPAGTASVVDSTIIDMAVLGSKVSPVVYRRRGEDPQNLEEKLLISKLTFAFETATLPEYSDFGDIANGLANGLNIRLVNGAERHVITIRDNAELAAICGNNNFQILDATNPAQGINGINATLDLEALGINLELTSAGDIKIIVQDDLSSLARLTILCKGKFLCK